MRFNKESLASKQKCIDSLVRVSVLSVVGLWLIACGVLRPVNGPTPGPDRQAEGTVEGAVLGAGAGAVTGFQVGAGTGPGALVGAGFGAVVGGIQGAVQDSLDEELLRLSAEARTERERVYAQEVLQDQIKRRLEIHPTREIYPADLFFYGDEMTIRPSGKPVVWELARLNKERLPWSRLAVAVYIRAASPDSEFGQRLAERRSRALVDEFVRAGLEPRRVMTRAVIVNAPILIDPLDRVDRYNQAVELIALDR